MLGCEPAVEPPPELIYDREFPQIGYAGNTPGGRVGQFAAALEDRSIRLEADPVRGYLDAVLDALDIDASSQVLVFSRTSLQTRHIRPETPRAIYFNDDTSVAWIPGAPTLEIASFDPALGPVFYTLLQDDASGRAIEREFGVCLRCHDTYGMSGGGVPRMLLGSGYTGTDGELVSHEAWILTSQGTPFRSRWGGWYVTGQHGEEVHLGNIVVEQAEDLQELEALRVGNVDDLGSLFDTSAYLRPTSDIVALMILEHQVEVQNLISRLHFEAAAGNSIDSHAAALLDAMLMLGAIAHRDTIEGDAEFVAQFVSRGPRDSAGRSLRDLDLQSRLFTYPLSYLIYSDAFQALPPAAKALVYQRLRQELNDPAAIDDPALTLSERAAIIGILRDTLPEVLIE